MAFTLSATAKVVDPWRADNDPSDGCGERMARLMVAATADETKAEARQINKDAPGQTEPKEAQDPEVDLEDHEWYESCPCRQGFVSQGSSPPRLNAVWTAIDEVHDRRGLHPAAR